MRFRDIIRQIVEDDDIIDGVKHTIDKHERADKAARYVDMSNAPSFGDIGAKDGDTVEADSERDRVRGSRKRPHPRVGTRLDNRKHDESITAVSQLITEDPNFSIDIAKNVIITVPHARAGRGDDDSSIIAAKHIEKAFKRRGIRYKIFYGTIPRSERDLNRKNSRDYTWRRELSKTMGRGDLLLDIHSYNTTSQDYESWRYADCIIMNHKHWQNNVLVAQLVRKLQDKNIVAISETPRYQDDIVKTAMQAGVYGLLVEFNDARIDIFPRIATALSSFVIDLQKLNI